MAPLPLREGGLISFLPLLRLGLELEANAEANHSRVQNFVGFTRTGIGNEPIGVDIICSQKNVAATVKGMGIEQVKNIGSHVDPASFAHRNHLFDSQVDIPHVGQPFACSIRS